ncbi:MAG: 1-phosphofructokinase [Oscillospiraceae bacterium]|nr:1-phosphofructokinase [Oscillospiraceae bacterium]
MIYTVTFNPAIDYIVYADNFDIGRINRVKDENVYFGGKGINISVILRELGVPSRALGFTAGFTGEAIENGVRAMGIDCDFIRLPDSAGISRINVKVRSSCETDLNAAGPMIDSHSLGLLKDKLSTLTKDDTLILAGSIPASLSRDIYEKILEMLPETRTCVDAEGKLLVNVLHCRPFLIKPNSEELSAIFGEQLTETAEIISAAKKLKGMGARNVLVSRGDKGAILVDENGGTHICRACAGKAINTVGAGDSMLAGFIAGLETGNYDHALRLASAAGGATAFTEGLAVRADIDRLFSEL